MNKDHTPRQALSTACNFTYSRLIVLQDYTSPSSQYVSPGDYPRALSMHNPVSLSGYRRSARKDS